jgi:hypothetical protein
LYPGLVAAAMKDFQTAAEPEWDSLLLGPGCFDFVAVSSGALISPTSVATSEMREG